MVRTSRRRTVAALAAFAATGLTLAALAGPAGAAETGARTVQQARDVAVAQAGYGYFTADGVRIRTGPGTNRTVLGKGYKNQKITIYCTNGGPAPTYNWWHIRNNATGVKGWVYWPENIVQSWGSPEPPEC